MHKKPEKRLGYTGAKEYQSHPWFIGFDWDAIENKKMKSPYKDMMDVKPIDVTKKPDYENYDNAISSFLSKEEILNFGLIETNVRIKSREQKLFRNWEFVRTENILEEQAIFEETERKKAAAAATKASPEET